MARMGLTATDRWHLLDRHACHHVEDTELVEVRNFEELELTHPEWGLGVPGGDNVKWCSHCKQTIDDMTSRRYDVIAELKRLVPYRNIDWIDVECAGDCPWCRKVDSATLYNEDIDDTVCPVCAQRYNSRWPEVENPPETDRRQEKPVATVESVRYTRYTGETERPPEESSSFETHEKARQCAGEECRPYVEVTIKTKYADVVCDIGATGYWFTVDTIEHIESLQAEQKAQADEVPEHKSHIYTDVDERYVKTSGLFPEDARAHADDLAAIAADPSNWQ